MLTALLLATKFALTFTGTPQTVELKAEAGHTYKIEIVSYCDCNSLTPHIVVPVVGVLDASKKVLVQTKTAGRGVDKKNGQFELDNELAFTAPATATYTIYVQPLETKDAVAVKHDRFVRPVAAPESGSRHGRPSDGGVSYPTPVAGATSGRVTITIR
jgi:hypothetical protein